MSTMAASGSLRHIFENPMPENPTLLESLSSWNQMKPTVISNIDQSSFTEIFGELHFKEKYSDPVSSSSVEDSNPQVVEKSTITQMIISPKIDSFSSLLLETNKYTASSSHKSSNDNTFLSMNAESLQLCTEGLGFESSDEIEDLNKEMNKEESLNWPKKEETSVLNEVSCSSVNINHMLNYRGDQFRKARTTNRVFPPPISSISDSGKPWVCFKSYRKNGRFVLKEIRIPTQEFLHACREDGRLKLHFVHPNDEIVEEDDEYNEDKDEDEDDHKEEKDELEEDDDGDDMMLKKKMMNI